MNKYSISPGKVLQCLRDICLSLPETRETIKWGNPSFDAGKTTFAVLDKYDGKHCIAFRAGTDAYGELLADSRFFPAPYASKHGWICLDAGKRFTLRELRKLLTNSYRSVAIKRMLDALDSAPG